MLQDTQIIKSHFPVFSHHPDLVFLDSAASAQKPKFVLDAWRSFCESSYANIHRGSYELSLNSTAGFETAREKISKFLGTDKENLILAKNGTEASNVLVNGFEHAYLEANDEIIIAVSEHHANFLPWQQVCKRKNAKLKVVHPNENGIFTVEHFKQKITERTKAIVFAHVSNVTGQIFPISDIVKLAKYHAIFTIVDACQSVPHLLFKFDDLGIDAAFFTGHKIGAGGTGGLLLHKKFKNKLPPFLFGGDMVMDVTEDDYTMLPQPEYLEPGTPAIENVVALGAACDYLESIGGMEKIQEHEKKLITYGLAQFEEKLQNWKIVGPTDANFRSGNISFYHPSIHHSDVTTILSEKNIAVRNGFHCANPLHHFLKIPGTIRASFWVYNTEADIDVLVEALKEVEEIFG